MNKRFISAFLLTSILISSTACSARTTANDIPLTESSESTEISNEKVTTTTPSSAEEISHDNVYISEEEQLATLLKSRDIWSFTDLTSYTDDYYAVTDFDQDGYYEILAITTGGSGHSSLVYLYEVNSSCSDINLVASFGAPEEDFYEIDFSLSDIPYQQISETTYSYNVQDYWRFGWETSGTANYALNISNDSITLNQIGGSITEFPEENSDEDIVITFYDRNDNAITEEEYNHLFFDTIETDSYEHGICHIAYSNSYGPESRIEEVSDYDLYFILRYSLTGFELIPE